MNKKLKAKIEEEANNLLADIPSHDYGLKPVEETRIALFKAIKSQALINWIVPYVVELARDIPLYDQGLEQFTLSTEEILAKVWEELSNE